MALDEGAVMLYVLSIVVVHGGLICLLLWGVLGASWQLYRGTSVSQRHRTLLAVPVAGFLMLVSAFWLARTIRGPLPLGSHLRPFDSVVWQDPSSSQFVYGDITPRQKMLGSLLGSLNPTVDRARLETLLGPSLGTRYLDGTGHALVYAMGPERDALFRIDSEWLVIWLDDSGHFVRWEIQTD
jgi:hypothetical protein